jgi:hypothetical protein
MKIEKNAKIISIKEASRLLYSNYNYYYCQPVADIHYNFQALFAVCSVNTDDQRIEYHVIQKNNSTNCAIYKKEKEDGSEKGYFLNDEEFEKEFFSHS